MKPFANFVVVAMTLVTSLEGQEPVTLEGDILAGVVDFHVHSGPDSFTRSLTDIEIARMCRRNPAELLGITQVSSSGGGGQR